MMEEEDLEEIPEPAKPPTYSALSAGLALHRQVAKERKKLSQKPRRIVDEDDLDLST
jgi:hypothetical protein